MSKLKSVEELLEGRARPPACHHHACDAAQQRRVQARVVEQRRPDRRPNRAPERERRLREGVDDGADSVACGRSDRPTAIATKPLRTQLTPSSATRARRERRCASACNFGSDSISVQVARSFIQRREVLRGSGASSSSRANRSRRSSAT